LEAAAASLRRTLELKPNDGEAQEMLKNIESRLEEGKRNESIQLYRQGLDALAEERREDARELIQNALTLWPENPDAKRLFERLSSISGRSAR
jgi:tetratricopeptide (TPR) repeat protein